MERVLLRRAIIPVGGVGSRLYPLTVDTSKAMVRFLNRPLIEFIVLNLASQGIREIYFGVSGYTNYVQLFDFFGSGEGVTAKLGMGHEVRIRYMPNYNTRGNAEAVLVTARYYEIRTPVLIVQCDDVIDIDIAAFWRRHRRCGGVMTIALKEIDSVEELRRFGVAELGEGGVIERFVEKPRRPEEAPSRLVNTGAYILDTRAFIGFFDTERGRRLLAAGALDFGRDVIPAMIEEGYRVCAYEMRGYWYDIGTPESYREAVFTLLKTLPPDELRVDFVYGGLKMMGRRELSRRYQRRLVARVERGEVVIEGDVLIGRHSRIGKGVRVRDSVIDHYVVVGRDAVIEDSIVMDRVNIGKKAVIRNSIIGRHVTVDEGVVVEDSIIGDNVYIGREAVIKSSRIWPHKHVLPRTTLIGATIT